MTYGPDAQPAIGWRSSERGRDLKRARGWVSMASREIRLACAKLRENPHDVDYRSYLPRMWQFRRLAQKQIRRLEGGE